jgi:hypothetical protein
MDFYTGMCTSTLKFPFQLHFLYCKRTSTLVQIQTLTKVMPLQLRTGTTELSVFQTHTRILNMPVQLKDFNFRNMCGSNPLQFHFSQILIPGLLHFQDISIYIHIRKLRERISLNN